MRKNGFTLIELLAVIVILAIIALIATPIILGIINDAREKANERSVELYAAAVKNGIAAYQLVEGKEVAAGTYTKETLPFEVEYDGKVDCTSIILSEDSKVSLEGCKVNGGEKKYSYGIEEEETPSLAGTMGICNPLYVQTEGEYTAGDKYECKVDPNREPYTFYVLTTPNENDTSVNLIMDSNINISGEAVKSRDIEDKGLVAWINSDHFLESGGEVTDEMLNDGDMCELVGICVLSKYGPITAIEYLQTATEGWTNTNELIINKYTGHDGAKYPMAEYILNARMPVYLSDTTKTEVAKKTETNSYLYDNLTLDEPRAYWTLSSNNSNYAWIVGYNDVGTASERINYIGSDVAGVRPVINLSI